jgi:hypothetical protein
MLGVYWLLLSNYRGGLKLGCRLLTIPLVSLLESFYFYSRFVDIIGDEKFFNIDFGSWFRVRVRKTA